MSQSQKKPILSFDLDGTLMKPGFGDKVWLEGLPEIYAETHNLSLKNAQQELLAAYDRIGNTQREWYDLSYWIHKLNLSITPEELLHKFQQYITPFEEVPDLLKRLSKEYDLIISSAAMKPFIIIELKTAKLYDYFTSFFSATSDTHTVKKDPYFYQMIIKKLKCDPQDIIHVGDNEQFDYFSPIKAGLKAYYLDRSASSSTNHIITTLEEFEEIIKNDSEKSI